MKLILLVSILFYSTFGLSQDNKKWAIYSETGISQIPFNYPQTDGEKLIGIDLKVGLKYSFKQLFIGISLNHSSYSDSYNPSNFQLDYNNDISVVGYTKSFYQETTFSNNNFLSFNVGYDLPILKSVFIRSLLGAEIISQKSSRTILYSSGNYEPTKVGYYRSNQLNPDFELRLGIMKRINYIKIGVMSSITYSTAIKSINIIAETVF